MDGVPSASRLRVGREVEHDRKVATVDSAQWRESLTQSIEQSPSRSLRVEARQKDRTGEFDPGSERTLAAGLTHASRAPLFGEERRTGE